MGVGQRKEGMERVGEAQRPHKHICKFFISEPTFFYYIYLGKIPNQHGYASCLYFKSSLVLYIMG